MKINKIYIGNMSYSTTENDLASLFGQCGNVTSASVIKDRYTGRSKGFGFVEFENNDSANAAVEKFNGYDLGGRQLRVNIAMNKQEGDSRRRDSRN
ncbi:MAG: RNA-binding protein [Holosporales bacterium]|jgi:RNA recognition motif-containing protein|nr:RNA-binding protein [Holosporales bacterium]